MINEDYCSYEVAKLLKEKGFDYQGFDYIDFEGEVIRQDRPTHQIAMKWLREVHNIFIDICTLSPLAYTYRVCLISDTTGCLYEDYACEEGERFMSYEEAVEFALDYCLNNILEV